MSEEALRRALSDLLDTFADFYGEPSANTTVAAQQRAGRAALSEGQAPEPVAQEPYGWATPEGAFTRNRGESDLWSTTRIQHVALYEMPTQTHCQMPTDRAGMDAARAKAIAADAALITNLETLYVSRIRAGALYEAGIVDAAIRALATKGAVS